MHRPIDPDEFPEGIDLGAGQPASFAALPRATQLQVKAILSHFVWLRQQNPVALDFAAAFWNAQAPKDGEAGR